jgi:DNA-directed RNA polymerase subunit RPC12/RpoP
MSTPTRWECYLCNGKGTQNKTVEKVQPDQKVPPGHSGLFKRVFRRAPPPPEVVEVAWVQEKCARCGGTGVLMLSLEEVQKLEDQHNEEQRRQLQDWGFATGPRFLVIDPVDQPIRPPRPDLFRARTYRCSKCGYTARDSEFPTRKNTLDGGDEDAHEWYCPKCGQRDPKDISPPGPRRTVNWDDFGEPRHSVKPFDRFND